MAIFTQTFVPNMTSAQYDAASLELKPLLENFTGWLGFHAAAVVDGGMQITEAWTNETTYKMWINDVVATKIPTELFNSRKATITPLHNVVLSKTLVSA